MSLTPKPFIEIGLPFIKLSSVDSTNNYALNLIKTQDVSNGTAIFSELQTNGKGQMGKQWFANAKENIILSIILDISTIHPQNQFYLLACAAMGCLDFVKNYAGNQTAIKWSNDIYFKDNKAGGILIETTQKGDKRFAIVGIGINVNQKQFNQTLKATSLSIINFQDFDIDILTKELIKCIEVWYNKLLCNYFMEIKNSYNKYLYKKNQTIMLKKGNISFNATIKEVNEFGDLVVENCIYEKFTFGEVSWL